ncbi:MAG TPA: FAD-dependent oxidoreductase [Dehalococcoidales bacterium]|nr:FAD-dependent oxidoreductase [Dehalococcoidales bacterium]
MEQRADFEIPPPPVHPDEIKETVETDVVVVGGGIAGLSAALSAAEAGAKTVILEKSAAYNYRGVHNAALHSRLQKEAGIKVDPEKVIYTIMEFGGYRGDQKVVKTWADNCDAAMDWLLAMAESDGIKVVLDPTTKPWYFPNYPVIHMFLPERQKTLAEMLFKHGKSHGVEYRFETPAVQLLREGLKKVTAVIARDKSGQYALFKARKGVVLCSGDYGNNREMTRKYCLPSTANLPCAYSPSNNTGDGLRMAMWIGAAIDEPPHCQALFDWSAVWYDHSIFNVARQPWLRVNQNGERFMNEDLPWGYECNQIIQQPGGMVWAIWDDKWKWEAARMQSQCCKNMLKVGRLWRDEYFEKAVLDGDVLAAFSLEELSGKMDLPADILRDTVARYNQLAQRGQDLDFGKHPERLTTIEKAPFYACKIKARFLVVLSGLKINNRMQVLDGEKRIIAGLYAAGNVSGSFFTHQYPTTVPGLTHSRAFTFGRLAGQQAAAEKAMG